jgi:predicted phage terminase large subunit-like protein
VEAFEEIPELAEIDAELGQRSMSDFMQLCWEHIEPGVELEWSWHLDAICEHLEAVLDGEIKNLAINIPPRSLKSNTCAVIFPVYGWIRKASLKFLFSSYSQQLSTRDSLKCRRLVQSPWFQQRWGSRVTITGDQNVKTRYDTEAGGFRFATSVGGTVTGEGGDILVVDDPLNLRDALSDAKREAALNWWDLAWSSRLNDPRNGAKIIVMQRLHEKDLTGHVLDREPDLWTHLCLPMEYDGVPCVVQNSHACSLESKTPIGFEDPRKEPGELLTPDRLGPSEIEQMKGSVTEATWIGQYQQRPTPRGGLLIREDWFQIVDQIPANARICRAWDLAATEEAAGLDPSWTVGLKLAYAKSLWIIMHVLRFRGNPDQVRRMMLSTAQADGVRTKIRLPQDPGQAGKSQVRDLIHMLSGFPVKALRMTGDKVTRADPWIAQAAAGNVALLRGVWNSTFLSECAVFPVGADQSKQIQGHDVKVKDVDGVLQITIDGQRLRYVAGYQIARQPGSPQPVIVLTLAVRRLNDESLVHLAQPVARGM